MTRDTNTQRFRDRLLLRPKFIVAVTLTLASILVVSAVVELYQMKKEIRHIMSEEASSLIEAIAVSSDNATLAYSEIEHQMAERLLNNARLIARMSQQRQLSQNDLAEIAQDNSLYRINLFDENGRKVLSSHTPDHTNSTELNRQEDFIRPLLTEQTDDLVIGFKDSRYGRGKRYAVAVERPGGGAVVVNIDADEMLQLRKDIGVGTLINDIAEREGIEYVAIQDTLGIIAASQNVTSLSKLKNDPFLIQAVDNKTPSTRMSEFDGRQTFEVAAPFIIDGVSVGLFRIGLKSDHLIEANARTKRRLALITVILLAGGVLVFNFIIVNQNYKLLDEAYLRTKTYTGKILENMADAVVAINRDQKITLFNQAAELFFGVTAKDAIGKSCSELIRSESILEKTLRSGRGVTDVETQYNLPEKRAIISISTFALQEKNGEVDSAVAVIKDLTERRAMEETLRRKEKLTAMGELASGVAHEVRNPLNAISMIAQRLHREFEPRSDVEEYKSLSKTVVNEVLRINDIIQRFLGFARPPKLELRMTNLNEPLNEAATLVKPEASAKGIEISENFERLPEIPVDSDQLKQTFLNLLQNGVQATDNGGKIDISTFCTEKEVVIEIQDTGHGISKEHLPRVFDLYFTTKEHGSGMGLSIAHQIVTAHGGRLEVESEVQKGTTFRVYLPRNAEI